jgi:hypothetical protein
MEMQSVGGFLSYGGISLPRKVVLRVDNHRTVFFMDKHVGWNFTTADIMVVSSTASLCNLLRKKVVLEPNLALISRKDRL